MMQLTDFDYDLPDALIARYPTSERSSSRLLHVTKTAGALAHYQFKHIVDLLQPGDLLVLNNSKVLPARLQATKATGAKVEILIERILTDHTALAMVRSNRSPQPGAQLFLAEDVAIEVVGREEQFFVLQFLTVDPILSILEYFGEMPIPPYLNRQTETSDLVRYQTVYANPPGSVAAPTAGLHFDEALLAALADKGIAHTFVTCHVGAGTFQPVKATDITQHKMHAECIQVDAAVCDQIHQTKKKGGRVIAVGTTSVRCLETAASDGQLQPYQGDTDIFIYPGYEFKVIDALITNFHLPQSSLIMLVAAFAGYDLTMQAYQTAIAEQYRFYSFGDAMLITD